MSPLQLLDVVALTTDLPERGLVRGQVGTVVEILWPDTYEIEFSDDDGRTYAQLPLREDQLLVLRYRPQKAA
jgi:hypothetical protein